MHDLSKKGGIFTKGEVSLTQLEEALKRGGHITKAGAIFTFTGIVRESSLHSEKKVVAIEIEAWPDKASEEMETIAQEVQEQYGLVDIRVWHATGRFRVGEEMIFVVVAARHRSEGLEAIEQTIRHYKKRSPIWKKEIYEDGSEDWISGKDKR